MAVGSAIAVDVERHHQGSLGVRRFLQFPSVDPLTPVPGGGVQEVRDLDRYAVLIELKVGGDKVGDRLTPAVRHMDIDVHDVDCDLFRDRGGRGVRASRLR